MLGCALVVALLAVNTHLFRSSLWFVPPGVESEMEFVTLGAYSAEGRFDAASAADMRTLDDLGFRGRYSLYGRDQADVELAGRSWLNRDVVFVSDGFFTLMGIGMAVGSPSGGDRSGVVLDYEFWRGELGGDRGVVGRTVQISGHSLPVVGVAGETFRGLGDRRPALWIPERLRAACLRIAIEGEGIDVEAIKAAIAEELPVYHAIVALEDRAEREKLVAWKVGTAESVSKNASDRTAVTVSVNRRDFRPAVLDGIDLVPAETEAIARYLWLLSGLSLVLAVLAVLNLGAYWSARTTERAQEIQIRHALGARLGDLLRLFANEALPFLGAVVLVAVPIAALQLKVLHGLEPFRSFLQNRFVHLGPRDFAPSLAVLAIVGVIALLAPLSNVLQGSLRGGLFGASAVTTRRRLAMATVQWVLVTFVAGLAGASLMAGWRMSRASWGGDGDPLLIRLALVEKRQPLLDALGLDVSSAATVEIEPLDVLSAKHDAYVPGLDAKGRRMALYENAWSPAAVTRLGVPIRAGRVHAHSESEAMVSESYARALGVDPRELLGRRLVRIASDGRELPPRTIVGVLGDVHYNDLRTAPEMVVYVAPEAGRLGSTLLFPPSERGRIDAALLAAGGDREVEMALAAVVPMSEVRDDRARTESLLSFGTFAYALLALALLMLGIVAEARMQLAQRGRELALVVSLGARLEDAVLRFLRAPLLVSVAAMALVLAAAVPARQRWLHAFPMLGGGDLWSIGVVVLVTVVGFALALVGLAAMRMRALSLAELLRVER
ncbi:MAG: FtsX-like permease family protein [Thermoanaerobaculia bacterium]